MSNEYEVRARAKKANAIASLLFRLGASSQKAALLPKEDRKMVAKLVKVNPPSDETWEMAIDFLRTMNKEARPVLQLDIKRTRKGWYCRDTRGNSWLLEKLDAFVFINGSPTHFRTLHQAADSLRLSLQLFEPGQSYAKDAQYKLPIEETKKR